LKTKYYRERPILKAVIDASPLFAALILELVDKSPEAHRKSILEKSALPEYLMGSPSRQRAFIQLLNSIPKLLTTSQVNVIERSGRGQWSC
jgi:hypothetical protein